jgi:hypothetical protein
MLSLNRAGEYFDRGIERARGIVALVGHLSKVKPEALSCDDLLRAAIVCSSSAFDLFHHQAFRALMYSRLVKGNLNIPYLLPTSVVHLSSEDALPLIDKQIRESLSHRSFLMPDKIAELYSPVIPNFWKKVAEQGGVPDEGLKSRVKQLGQWRNRIVHESDINPDLAGIEEWPILSEDVVAAIDDYAKINMLITVVINQHQ